MSRYDFEPSAVGRHIAKVSDEPTRTALAIVAAMVYQAQESVVGLVDLSRFFNSCSVDVNRVTLPSRM